MSAKQKIKSGFSRFLPSVRLRKHEGLDAYTNTLDEASNKLTPNLRALRLAIAVSDQLLSMDVAANGVVSRALDITEAYCDHPVHVDIISNVIMLSQLRGVDKEPLTLIRPSVMRDTNNMTVQLIQQLVHDIRAGKYSLDEAEAKLDSILKNPVTYPAWLVSTGNAGIAAAVSLFFTTNWRVVLVTFAIALGVDRLLALMAKRAIPPFFRQAGAAVFIVLAAALVAQLDKHGVGFFSGMNPTLIVVGGIFMLVAGLVIVAAIRDAIEEYYVTANARLLKVVMQTTGIVVGILTGLYIARKLGIGIAVSPDPLQLTAFHFQAIAGALAAAAYAVATQTRIRAIIWAGLVGGGAVAIMFVALNWGINVVPATGVAAIYVGIVSGLFSRLWQTPGSAIVSAGIIPLVPGLALYTGLMQLVNYPPADPLFFRGVGTLFTALATAVTIAAGASLGTIIAQPVSKQLTHTRNLMPLARYMTSQLKFDRSASKRKQS